MNKTVDIHVGLIHIGNREKSGLQILEKLNQYEIKVSQWDVITGNEQLQGIEVVDVIVVNIGKTNFEYDDLLANIFDKNIKVIINEAILSNNLTGVKRRSWERHLLHKIDSSFSVIPTASGSNKKDECVDFKQLGIKQVWILAASIGGPDAIQKFLSQFQGDEKILCIIIQHMDKEFVPMMVEQFDNISKLHVLTPISGMKFFAANCLICPTDEFIHFNKDGTIELFALPKTFAFSPSIDENCKKLVSNIKDVNMAIFSGMSKDGILGAQIVKQRGSKVITQSEDSCVLSTIVTGVKKHIDIDFDGTPEAMAKYIINSL